MISKTKINRRVKRKTNSEIVETLKQANKNPSWRKVAQKISAGRRNYLSINLNEIDKKTSEGDTVAVVGKILGKGEVTKKVRVCALGFSESALEKMKSVKSEAVRLIDEIKKNPKAEGVKII